jgi:hypothetical protein
MGGTEGYVEEGSGDEASLSIGAPLGNMEGGSFMGGTEGYVDEGSGDEASLSIGAPLGNLDGSSFTRDSAR